MAHMVRFRDFPNGESGEKAKRPCGIRSRVEDGEGVRLAS